MRIRLVVHKTIPFCLLKHGYVNSVHIALQSNANHKLLDRYKAELWKLVDNWLFSGSMEMVSATAKCLCKTATRSAIDCFKNEVRVPF